MNIPFSTEEFLNVFRVYNESIWPLQILFNLAAIILIIFLFKRNSVSDRIITYTLSFFWLWIGIIYHLIFFTQINPAAYVFAVIFILQGVFFFLAGLKNKFQYLYQRNFSSVLGIVLILYALLIYPMLGYLQGHIYPSNPTFGLPCPTTIFTFGMLLQVKDKIPPYYVGIPLIWSIVGFMAALKLGIIEDTGLLVAGLLSAAIIIFAKRKQLS